MPLEIRRQAGPFDNSSRIRELEQEIGSLTGAIAGGLLRASPALAQRLSASEKELERLQAAQRSAPTTKLCPGEPNAIAPCLANCRSL